MKIRRGFVTNSSSTNDIFQAMGTAAAAAFLGTVINIVEVSKNTQLVSYALLETTHNPEEPRPPQVRVNDSGYTVWFYAAVRCIDVSISFDSETGTSTSTVIKDDYDSEYTSKIKFSFSEGDIMKWLTFGSEGTAEDGSADYSSMQGDFKACGFMCESIYNDRPRRQRKGAPASTVSFSVSVNVGEKVLSKSKKCDVLDEADLYVYGATVLNDSSIETKMLINVLNPGRYSWDISTEPYNPEIAALCSYSIEDIPDNRESKSKYLVVTPSGKELKTKENPNVNSQLIRLKVTGKPNASHIPQVSEDVDIQLVEEGLIVTGTLDNEGYLIVKAYIDEEKEKEKEMQPTRFDLSCIIKIEDAKHGSTAMYVDMEKVTIDMKDMEGSDDATKNLAQAFKYKIDKLTQPGAFTILPEMQLPAGNTPYKMMIPITCDYEGESYELKMPVKLYGHPYGEKEKWAKEYNNLKITIQKYIPKEEWEPILKGVEDRKEKISSEDLRLLRRSIFETARDKLLKEAAGYEQLAVALDWTVYGLEWAKWFGDQAFSYLMATYTGPVGEALLVPCKDLFTMVIADQIGKVIFDGGVYKEGELERGVYSQIFTSFENLIMMDGDKKVDSATLDVKKLGTYLAAFCMVKCFNHYMFDRKEDGSPIGLWDALVETAKDLTSNCMKILVGKYFEKLMKSEKMKKVFENYLIRQVKEFIMKKLPDSEGNWEEKSFDIVNKYLQEFGGMISSAAYGKTIEIAGQTSIDVQENDTIITLNFGTEENPWIVKFSYNKVKESLFNYVFNSIFSAFTFASAPVTVSDDPTFYKA